jgi:hypothetical protein
MENQRIYCWQLAERASLMTSHSPSKSTFSDARQTVLLLILALTAGVLGGERWGTWKTENREQLQQRDSNALETSKLQRPPTEEEREGQIFLLNLINSNPAVRERTIRAFTDRNDLRIVSPLLTVFRFGPMNNFHIYTGPAFESLKEITGQDFGYDWEKWFEWWWQQDAPPEHPGFSTLLAHIYGDIDPDLGFLMYPGWPTEIRRDTIMWGGVKFDGIPALIGPQAVPANHPDAALYLDNEPVFGVVFNGEARAYPLRVMDWHEMVNDTVGGQQFAISYCTLCGAAVGYNTNTSELGRIIFGSSGFLRNSNKLMYDRATRTLWSAIEGRPLLGPLTRDHSDFVLERLPVVRTSWATWKAKHPNTTVITTRTGYRRDYRPGKPYGDYFASPETMFPVMRRDNRLKTKQWIYTQIIDGEPKAYPVKLFVDTPLIHDTHQERDLLLLGDPMELSVRAYATQGKTFQLKDDGDLTVLRDQATGAEWRVTEEALIGPQEEALPRLPGHLAYWFGWFAAHPDTEVYQAPGK